MKKIICLSLILIMIFSAACSKKDESKETETLEAPMQTEEENLYPEDQRDLLGESLFNIVYSADNIEMGGKDIAYISSYAEFAKFAPVFAKVHSSDMDMILNDNNFKGLVFVSKIVMPSDTSRYNITEVYKYDTDINISVSESLLDHEPIDSEKDYRYAYILFGLPDVYYNDENINVSISF